jgi:hypothetical protein
MAKEKPKKPKKKKDKDGDYVDNARLYQELVDYKKKREDAENSGRKKPKLPDYIGESILKIASRLSYRPNFANYSYREEMVSDAVLNCITYIDNFDPDVSKSPFGYLTQICWFSFVRIINKEKKEKYIQFKLAESKNDPEFHKWFNEKFSGVENGFKDAFGIGETEVEKMDKLLEGKKKGRKKKAKDTGSLNV